MPEQTESTPDSKIKAKADLVTIALVGRPNVGKSTLFNRLIRSRKALVAPIPGTTRDRREAVVKNNRFRFQLVDTGGMAFDSREAFSKEIKQQIESALGQADLIWFMLDSKEGLNPFDTEMYRWLLKLGKPVMVLINKIDTPGKEVLVSEFHALGTESLFSVSATHGLGMDGLLEHSAELFPAIRVDEEEEETDEKPLRVAFLGQPNVGKSSLVNKLLGEQRMIVSQTAGTTRESIETPFVMQGRNYILVDTAGLKRRARTKGHLDKISALNALNTLNRVDVVILVLDASVEAVVQDSKIAREIIDHRRACVVALNKCDLQPKSKRELNAIQDSEDERLRFVHDIEKIPTSAVTGEGLTELCAAIERSAVQFTRKIQTADLNRVVEATTLRTPPPARGRHGTKIFYGTQIRSRPPSFVFYTNNPDSIGDDYTRFMEHQLRFHFGLKGVPLRIQWKSRRDGKSGKNRIGRRKKS